MQHYSKKQDECSKSELEENYKCTKCKDWLFILQDDGTAKECECRQLRIAEDILERSGVGEELAGFTFDNFEIDISYIITQAYMKAIKYSDNFNKIRASRKNSIIFMGQVGSGKTHLSMAIANELMSNAVGVIYMPYRDSIPTLKHYIQDGEKYSKEINKYKNAPVLLIDDLYKGDVTNADIKAMFEIINHRYLKKAPMIISTEKTFEQLLAIDEAIGSRIIQMSKDYIIEIEGEKLNYRIYGN